MQRLLHAAGYSLQGNQKTLEGNQNPDRDAQFRHIHDTAAAFGSAGDPVVSIDCKKKELVGQFKNGGKEWRPAGDPEQVNVHDFIDKQPGKAIPYGVYDIGANTGWVSVGIDRETAAFAVNTPRSWWNTSGKTTYPDATRLLITADSGGANGNRRRAWKTELAALAAETGLAISVCHLPPGTSKWNKIEHRLFSQISRNWRGRPLESLETIINLIGATTTTTGLTVTAELDPGEYPTGVKISDQQQRRTFPDCNINAPTGVTGPTGASACMITASENNAQGGIMAAFYYDNRILEGDPYRVGIGSCPLKPSRRHRLHHQVPPGGTR